MESLARVIPELMGVMASCWAACLWEGPEGPSVAAREAEVELREESPVVRRLAGRSVRRPQEG